MLKKILTLTLVSLVALGAQDALKPPVLTAAASTLTATTNEPAWPSLSVTPAPTLAENNQPLVSPAAPPTLSAAPTLTSYYDNSPPATPVASGSPVTDIDAINTANLASDPQALDLYIPVKPVQSIILGYMGAFDYVKTKQKKYWGSNDWQPDQNISKYYHICGMLWKSFICPAPTTMDQYLVSRDNKWFANKLAQNNTIVITNSKTNLPQATLVPTCTLSQFDSFRAIDSTTNALLTLTTIYTELSGQQRLYVTDSDRCELMYQLWDIATQKVIFELKSSTNDLGVSISPDGQYIICIKYDRSNNSDNALLLFQIWDIKTRTLKYEDTSSRVHSACVANSADGKYIAYADDIKKQITIVDTKKFQPVSYLHNINATQIEFSSLNHDIACVIDEENSYSRRQLVKFYAMKKNPLLK